MMQAEFYWKVTEPLLETIMILKDCLELLQAVLMTVGAITIIKAIVGAYRSRTMIEGTLERLHQLLDALPDNQVKAVNKYLEALEDEAFLEGLCNAPGDDVPLTEDELKTIEEVAEDIRRRRTRPLDGLGKNSVMRVDDKAGE
jgi:hypothetical protein